MNKQPWKDYVSGYVYMGWVSVVGSGAKVRCDAWIMLGNSVRAVLREGCLSSWEVGNV
jgi:hypothetical protein